MQTIDISQQNDPRGVCPCCGGDDITGGFVEILEAYAVQSCHCSDCAAEWNDKYRFSGYEITHEPTSEDQTESEDQ